MKLSVSGHLPGMPKLSAAAIAAVATFAVSGTAAAATEPQMHFDKRMTAGSVCFTVTNPRGTPSVLYGRRYTDGAVSPRTPAIVLVHGIASSTANWDFTPTWSTARALASAGYVVYSYDRLGYAKSPYFDVPGDGYTLTTREHRRMLHEVVDAVKTGTYGTTTGGDCSGARQPGGMSNRTVVIIGHSAGGWIVAGYPGTYHDVAAMVQTDITGSSSQGDGSDGGSKGGGFTPDPQHPDYFQFFQTRQNCEDFNVYAPGAVPSAVSVACTPPFLDSPFGEIADLAAMYAENDVAIAQIGPGIPVLLTSGDHDTTAPPSAARADFAYYQDHCGCDVSQILLPATGHLFQVHASLAGWVKDVVTWLGARGLRAAG
jgi:pimeloyl-ACP methyl ester carboxylesterase